MEPIIKVDNVSMCFNLSTEKHESLKEYLLAMVQGRLQYDEFYALRDVSLDIMPGDFYGLVGLNGSGKSTLLKTIAGVYKPSKGKVTVNGTIAPLIELGAGFDMDLTARENIYLNGTVLGFSPKYLDEKFDEIVEFSELQNFLDVPLKNYSSGMVAASALPLPPLRPIAAPRSSLTTSSRSWSTRAWPPTRKPASKPTAMSATSPTRTPSMRWSRRSPPRSATSMCWSTTPVSSSASR